MTNELVIVTNLVSRDIPGLEVVGKVNELYSGFLNSLLAIIGIIAAFGGIVMPILIQIYQRRVMRVSEAELKAEMARLLEVEKKNLLDAVESKFTAEKSIIDETLQKKSDKILEQVKVASGGIFLIQGTNRMNENQMTEAAHDFCKAGELFCEGKAGAELAAAITNLILVVEHGIDKEGLDYRGLIKRIEGLIAEIKKMDSSKFMQPQLLKLQLALDNASKKGKPAK
jgi:hypothetical protein